MKKDELTFGQRFNGHSLEKVIQLREMDLELRTAVWNVVYSYLFKQFEIKFNEYNSKVKGSYEKIWNQIINRPLDDFPNDWQLKDFLKILVLEGNWVKVYEFLEDLYYHQVIYQVKMDSYSDRGKDFAENLNYALRKYNSGYTLINDRFIPVTNDEEIKEIKNLGANIVKFNLENIGKHYQTALDLFAQRPDVKYSKVIRECMCMIE